VELCAARAAGEARVAWEAVTRQARWWGLCRLEEMQREGWEFEGRRCGKSVAFVQVVRKVKVLAPREGARHPLPSATTLGLDAV
jgi:hypothetical protein